MVGISLSKEFQYVLRLCGSIRESFCLIYTGASALCQLSIPPTDGRLIMAADSGVSSSPLTWTYLNVTNPSLGVRGYIQNGYECGLYSLPSATIVQLVCDRTVPPPSFFYVDDSVTLPTSPVCLFLVTVRTAVSCPPLKVTADHSSSLLSSPLSSSSSASASVVGSRWTDIPDLLRLITQRTLDERSTSSPSKQI